MEFTTSVDIAADADTVWAALADPTTCPAWMPHVKDVTTNDAYAREGAQYKVAQSWYRMNDQTIFITRMDAPREFAFTAGTTAGGISFTYTLAETLGRVRLECVMRMEDGFAKLGGAILGGSYQSALQDEAVALRDYCERMAPQDVVQH